MLPLNVRPLSEVPRRHGAMLAGLFSGALSIEPYEGSRWRMRRTRGAMYFVSIFFAKGVVFGDGE
jgi:hypothetical protein